MALTYDAKGGKDFEKAPEGLHVAVCNLVADVGLQKGSPAFPDPKHKLYIRFELPEHPVTYEKDGKEITGPITIGAFFTASMHSKATLRMMLESWRGKKFTDDEASKFDVSSILGKPCQVQVMHSADGMYANVRSVLPAPKNCKEKAVNTLLFYSTEQDEQYNALPKWLQGKIDNQLQAPPPKAANKPTQSSAPATDDFEDSEIPF